MPIGTNYGDLQTYRNKIKVFFFLLSPVIPPPLQVSFDPSESAPTVLKRMFKKFVSLDFL